MAHKLIGRVPVAELPPGTMRKVPYPPFDVLLVNMAGVPYALDETCNHAGASLAEGKLRGEEIACPAHGYIFDVRTGALLAPKGLCDPQRTFEVVREGDVFAIYDPFPPLLIQ
jgi:nitrite reductase/ring-hydroxylating ferredoxin subunit